MMRYINSHYITLHYIVKAMDVIAVAKANA